LCFDFGVNAGTGRAAKYLQRMIGTTVDGGIGPNTLKRLKHMYKLKDLLQPLIHIKQNRQEYYEKLSTFETFGRGWTRRVVETTSSAHKLAKNS
jgi:lysozyme family protein